MAMATPLPVIEVFERPYDPSQPFKGIVVCCTSIPVELRVSLLLQSVLPPCRVDEWTTKVYVREEQATDYRSQTTV